MKYDFRRLTLALVLPLALLAFSCVDPSDTSNSVSTATGTLTITVATNKTVVPSGLAVADLTYGFLAAMGETSVESTTDLTYDAISIPGLAYGTWVITLTAYQSGNPVYGLTQDVVIDSYNKVVNWALEPLQTGTGDMNILLQYPTGLASSYSVSMSLYGNSESLVSVSPTPGSSGANDTLTLPASSIPSGNYVLTVDLSDANGKKVSGVKEMVRIYDYRSTDGTLTLTSDDFNAAPAVPTNFLANFTDANKTDAYLSWTDNSLVNEGFYIYKDGATVPFATIDNAVTTNVIDITDGQAHVYEISAYNDFGESAKVSYNWDQNATNFNVTLASIDDGSSAVLSTDDSTYVLTRGALGDSMTVTLTNDTIAYDTWTWSINGNVTGDTAPTITDNGDGTCTVAVSSTTRLGKYWVTVMYGVGGITASKTFILTVQE